MLKKIVDKRNYIILFIIILLIIFLIENNNAKKEYIKSFSYFNENITIKIYNKKNMNKTFNKIDNIYKKYNNYLKKPSNNKEYQDLLEYSKIISKKTNGLVQPKKDINIFIDIYATSKVIKYLQKKNINEYLISTNGNISAGKHYNNQKYKIGIYDFKNKIIGIAKIENENLIVKKDANKLIVAIGKELNETNYIASALKQMSLEDGREYVKSKKIEVLWLENEKIKTTKGFKKYLKN